MPSPDAAAPPLNRRPWRLLWLLGGFLALGLGLVGVITPVLPTVPFVLLAAWCFSKGSARWEAWLLAHPRWGPWCAIGERATRCPGAPSGWPGA